MPIKTNFIKKSVTQRQIIPDASSVIDDTVSFDQGDLLIMNTSSHLLDTIATAGSAELGATFLGIATQTIVDGAPKSAYQGTDVDASEGIPALEGPMDQVTALVVLKTSDSINPGDLVYPDGVTGARGVTVTAGSKHAIGVYQGPALSSVAAGTQIEVFLKAVYI